MERKHSAKYWSIVSEKFKDKKKKIEEELIAYWFLINSQSLKTPNR